MPSGVGVQRQGECEIISALCAISRQLGGRLELESIVGRGTTVVLTVPACGREGAP